MKLKVSLLISAFVFFFSVNFLPVAAALLIVKENGEIVRSVLSSSDSYNPEIPKNSALEVKKIAQDQRTMLTPEISLHKEDQKIKLVVTDKNGIYTTDVTSLTEDLVEIEELSEPQKIKISAQDDFFLITQKEVSAKTAMPIRISAQNKQISVETASGNKYVAILPYQAFENALKANLINTLTTQTLDLIENEKGNLAYRITGERLINFYNLYLLSIPVTTQISASDGRVLAVEQPLWFSIIDFLFV